MGGVARMATLIEKIREENRIKDIQTFVLLAGDIIFVFRAVPYLLNFY